MNAFERTLEEAMRELIKNSPPLDTSGANTAVVTHNCNVCHNRQVESVGDSCPRCTRTLARGYGIGYKGGRCWNGAHRDAGTVNHALPVDACDTSFDTAVCGTKPGSRSYGWVMAQEGQVVTCQRCLANMTDEQKVAGAGLTRREVRLITLARDSKHGFHGVTETNFGGACKGHSFYDVWMGLAKRGLASRRNAEGVMGYDFAFFPTPAAVIYAEAQQGLDYPPDFSEGGINDLRDKIARMVGTNYENGYWRNAPREEVVQYASKYLVWTGWKWRWPTIEERHERQISEVKNG